MSKANVQCGIFWHSKMRKNGGKKLKSYSNFQGFFDLGAEDIFWGNSIHFDLRCLLTICSGRHNTFKHYQWLQSIHNKNMLKFVVLGWVFTLAILKLILHYSCNALPFHASRKKSKFCYFFLHLTSIALIWYELDLNVQVSIKNHQKR